MMLYLNFLARSTEVVENSDGGLEFIMSLFGLLEAPHFTFFGDKLKSDEELSDEAIFACFMQVAISCFLCPSATDRLDTKYILQLGDPEKARTFYFYQLLYKHLILGTTRTINFIRTRGRKPMVFEFCSYALAVYYLDCLDFGACVAGSGAPRSFSWRSDMIKIYSQLDRKSNGVFGKRHVRKDLAGYYYNGPNISNANMINCGRDCEPLSRRHRETMHATFGMTLSGLAIDGVFDVVQSFISSHLSSNNKSEELVQNVLQFMIDARPWYKSDTHCQKVIGLVGTGFHPTINETQTFIGNKPGGGDMNSNSIAPAMHPVAKVKSRLKLCVPAKEGSDSGLCQADLISPIGRINLSPFPIGKEEAKPLGNSDVHVGFVNALKGSQKAPIPVGDTTPKAILDKKIEFSPEVTITGSSISKDRPNHTAAISFGENIPNVKLDRKVENSPEVTIIGTSSFKDRQNQLARDADAMYNQTVHPNVKNDSLAKQKVLASVPTTANVIELGDDEQLMDLDGHTIERKSDAGNGLIILQPKNNLVFPLAHNSRFPVSDEDIMHYCAIVDLAYKERVQKNYAIVYHGVHCNFVSLGQSLMHDGHIDNFLVPCFCRNFSKIIIRANPGGITFSPMLVEVF